MSRAFVNEDDLSHPEDELPERIQSPHPNYVTADGLAQLKRSQDLLLEQRELAKQTGDAFTAEESLRGIERNLRYAQARVASAILIDPADQPADEVAFGARVGVRDSEGRDHVYSIVGEDEADGGSGKASWVSPLARALRGSQVHDTVTWKRPSGDVELEIISIEYLNSA